MLFTHNMPGHAPLFSNVTTTMQIYSVKVAEIQIQDLQWPLEVYGVVAARDAVDYRRNLLFLRTRDDCQILTEEDPFLHLTGPSRAIMSTDIVKIEIQLKVKGTTKSKDIALITRAFSCDPYLHTSSTTLLDGYFCKIELRCEHLRQSIQATILSVRVKHGSLSSENGFQIFCYSIHEDHDEDIAEHPSRHVLLLDSSVGTVHVDEEGYVDLSRQVVSVKLEGRLEILIKTFLESGEISGRVVFRPEYSNVSQKTCVIGECELEITLAWSFLVDDEQDILMMSYTKPFMASHPLPFMKLVDEDVEDGSC
nr:uncharacterized protein LOC127330790 [Lolium perenne]